MGWKRIWRLRAQERAKVFIWLLSHDKVLSNWSRWRRQLTTSQCCDRCGAAKEDGPHAVRDCKGSMEVWLSFSPPSASGFLHVTNEGMAAHELKVQNGVELRREMAGVYGDYMLQFMEMTVPIDVGIEKYELCAKD